MSWIQSRYVSSIATGVIPVQGVIPVKLQSNEQSNMKVYFIIYTSCCLWQYTAYEALNLGVSEVMLENPDMSVMSVTPKLGIVSACSCYHVISVRPVKSIT